MSKIIPFREEIFHQINQILESQKAFIFLWGKSGSGKSVLLQRLAKKYNVDFINENFKDQSFLKEKIEFLISQGQSLIILDEVGMYDYTMLESIRIYSDSISFVLSSHKKLNILKKEHFKSRLSACFKLK
ncbi:ATP-binding protein, partial [Campylobacter jejuni]|nr:ATP-binding protein [Campylobacter jejuni]